MNNRLIIMGGNEHVLDYDSHDELWDKISSLPKEIKEAINMSMPLGAANADPMAGGYASTKVVQDGDTAYNTAAKVFAIYNAAVAGSLMRTWEYTVLPRYLVVWGSGILGAINNQGYLSMGCFKAGTSLTVNTQQLKVESYDRMRQVTVRSFNDTEANLQVYTTYATMTPSNNQAKMLALPRTTVIAAPYSRLAVDTMPITVAANNDSYWHQFPVTVKSS
jgi:hypothetical protein